MNASNIFSWLAIFAISLVLPLALFAQKSRRVLEQEKVENLRRIGEAEKILEQTETEKAASVGQLRALDRQIRARQDLIKSISGEVGYLTDEIGEITIVISSLESDLEQLRVEYASMIYSSSKTKSSVNRLTFLFSAKSFNQLLMRLKYLEQYSDLRKNQVHQMEKVRDALADQRKLNQAGYQKQEVRHN